MESTETTVMDDATVLTFEKVCQFDFLPYYLPQIYATDYADITCQVLDQNGSRRRDRRTQETEQQSVVMELSTADNDILVLIQTKANLPEAISFDDVCRRTFTRYIHSFQTLLSRQTPYFTGTRSRGGVSGINEDPTSSVDEAQNTTLMVILGSAVGGAVLAIGMAVFYLRRNSNLKGLGTPPQDITDDSVLLLFEEDQKNDGDDKSLNPYLPPTPLGIGVPSEIGPDSWIEPDDELSAASPDNQGVETAYLGNKKDPFGFDRSASTVLADLQKSNTDPGKPSDSSRALVPQSRAAMILASLASESFHRITSDPSTNLTPRSIPLDTIESRESEDDDTKPTLSSKGSHPTRASNNTGPTNGSQSDGSSTLHGLKLIGTMSGYQSNEGSKDGGARDGPAPVPSDYDSDPSFEKKAFFRKLIKRRATPTSNVKGPPVTAKKNTKYEFSNTNSNRPRLTLPKATSNRDDSSSIPTSASTPTQVMGNKKIQRSGSAVPTTGTMDSLLMSHTESSTAAQSTGGSSTAAQISGYKAESTPPTTAAISSSSSTVAKNGSKKAVAERPIEVAKTSSSLAGASKTSKTSSTSSGSGSKATSRTRRSRTYSNVYGGPASLKRPQLQEPSSRKSPGAYSICENSTTDTGPSPYSPIVLGPSQSVESISVDPRRAAGTPTDLGTMRKYEECTIRSPVESFVRKNETPKGTRFLQMSTDSAKHTGNVLEDLGRLEDEWDGQLESKLSATATTPRHTNSEKFRKAPRQHIYREGN